MANKEETDMKKPNPVLFGSLIIIFAICISNASHAQFSESTRRQTGAEILSELITKPDTYSTNRVFQNEHSVISEAKVTNYKYYLTVPKQYAQLKDGKSEEGSSPDSYLNVKLIDYVIRDLDGNGTDDAVVVLAGTPMGSGSFFEITTLVADTEDNVIRQTNSILLGDRTKIDSFSVKSGKIVLKLTVHGPDDPSCCPSKKVVRQFSLTDGKLVAIKKGK